MHLQLMDDIKRHDRQGPWQLGEWHLTEIRLSFGMAGPGIEHWSGGWESGMLATNLRPQAL